VAERWRAKKKLFAPVRALHLSGRRASAIVRETGVGRRRVDKWIRCTQLPTSNEMEPKPTSPRFFAAHLQRRWAEGCHEGPRLLTEIRALGYRGWYSSLAKFLARWRDHALELQTKSRPLASVSLRQQAGVLPTVSGQISPMVAAALLTKPRPLLTGWQAAKVDALKKACPDFARMRSLVMSFRGILQAGKVGALDEKSKRFRDLRDETFRAEVESRSGRGEERAQGKLEQWSCRRSYQSVEDAQAPDVWSSRLRTVTSPIAANGPRFPPAPKLRKNLIEL
jgi:hypothetical protein